MKRSFESLKEEVVKSDEYQKKIEKLEEENAAKDQTIDQLVRGQKTVDIILPSTNKMKFAIISDTHFGSTKERPDCLRDFYANCERRGITTILHCGDVLDGQDMYRGHRYEIHKHGWAAQRDHCVEQVSICGTHIETQFITGNHDASFKKLAGIDVGEELADRLHNWKHLAEDIATVKFYTDNGHEFRVLLIHPDGGTAYALSYKLQKLIEALPGGDKPHMVAEGHYHKMLMAPNYRNVYGIDAGCFQDQTNYMARKPTPAHKGGWIFEVDFFGEEKLRMHVKAETITYY